MNHGCLYRAESAITSASRSAHLVGVGVAVGLGVRLARDGVRGRARV